MGAVYRALHGRLKKAVALKLLAPGRTSDSQSISRFEREMEAIGRLNHNHIVRATDAGEADGVHYLVMELIDGVDLARLVRHCGPLPVAAACELVRQAAAGLQYAHENSLVHRDIKPSNLLLSVDGELKISDLGLALLNRNDAASGDLTVTGQVMGTADYMAPEQWEDSHAVDIRADLYSLGCTLYTLLVGSPPFGGPKHRSALRKMAAHAKELVRPITEQRADVPAVVEELRLRLMAKEPAERLATPAEAVKALEPFCRGADLGALARSALARSRPDRAAVPDQSTATRNAVAILSTPVAGQTVTEGPKANVPRKRRARPMIVGGAVLLTVGLAAGVWLCLLAPAKQTTGLPTVPAAPAPPLNLGNWQNLLAVRPAERLWTPDINSSFQYDPAAEVLKIDSAHPSLIRLGETEAPGYTLQVGLRQLTWTGGVGVYFGGRPSNGPGVYRVQLIQLNPVNPNFFQGFTLNRSVALVHLDPGGRRRLETLGFFGEGLSRPPDNRPQILELEIKPAPRGLSGVRWENQSCPDLITDGDRLRQADASVDDRGEFGIYCAGGSSVVVSTARFRVTD